MSTLVVPVFEPLELSKNPSSASSANFAVDGSAAAAAVAAPCLPLADMYDGGGEQQQEQAMAAADSGLYGSSGAGVFTARPFALAPAPNPLPPHFFASSSSSAASSTPQLYEDKTKSGLGLKGGAPSLGGPTEAGYGNVEDGASASSAGVGAIPLRNKSMVVAFGIVFVLFVLGTIGLAIALGIINEKHSHKNSDIEEAVNNARLEVNAARTCSVDFPPSLNFPPRVGDVFNPFTAEELTQIASFVRTKLNLAETEPESMIGADWLSLVDFLPADKSAVVNYLNNPNTAMANPGRYARAVVYRMTTVAAAHIEEYRVGPITSFPLPATTSATLIDYGGTIGTRIPQQMRPVSSSEYALMEPLVSAACTTIAALMQESYGETYADGRMWYTDSAPRGYSRAQRTSWIWFTWNTLGMYQLPIGLEMLIDHTSLNASEWRILNIVYNDQTFTSAEGLRDAYAAGTVTKLDYKFPDTTNWETDPIWSSLIRRGARRSPAAQNAPPLTAPQGGRRFGVQGHQVQWMGWDLHVGYSTLLGPKFDDIRFRNERIVYELALQDAFAGYSGYNPIQATSAYTDGGWGLGYSNFPLIPGVDCPPWAVFLDTAGFAKGKLIKNARSVCVWEQPDNIALMRHYDQDFVNGGFSFIAGYDRTSLIVRTTSTVYNYDYILSTVFHLDGTMEVVATATGYPQAVIYPTHIPAQVEESKFSARMSAKSIGSLHDHLFVWKVDLDVLGTANSVVRSEIKAGRFNLPYVFPGANTPLKYVDRQTIATENTGLTAGPASIRHNPNTPATFNFINTGADNGGRNAVGTQRGYSIHMSASIAQLNDPTAPWMPSLEWSLNNVVVTQRKESEPYASMPLYDMQSPAEPIFRFGSFSNAEPLVQQDLVAWVTIGSMHMPTTEDAPVTNTPGTTVSFLLRPTNYFDISPSVDLDNYYYRTGPQPQPGGPAGMRHDFLPPPMQRCTDPVDPPAYHGSESS